MSWTGIVPDCLAPGARYRILFVSANNFPAASRSNQIGPWNDWVREQAAASTAGLAAISASFKILGSTKDTNARQNTRTTGTGTDVKIFYFKGNKVADDYADLYDASWDSQTPRDENGDMFSGDVSVWTGTKDDGTPDNLGFWLKSTGNIRAGNPKKLE